MNDPGTIPRSGLLLVALGGWLVAITIASAQTPNRVERRPNILLAISDDQSYPYASAYGCPGIRTPAFDRVAREGVLLRITPLLLVV